MRVKMGVQESEIAYDSSTIEISQNYTKNRSAYGAYDPDDILQTSIYSNLTIDAVITMQYKKTFRLVKAIVYGQKKRGDGPIGVYRTSKNSDIWNCNICKQKGDIFNIFDHVPACLTRYNN